MSIYAIGDIQGCYEPLQRLLKLVKFNPNEDYLWLTGDLVNRGPNSFQVLRFLYEIRNRVTMVLGNHDLHFLAVASGTIQPGKHDTLDAILKADDCETLTNWLRKQPLLVHDLGFTLVHAGLPPEWDLTLAKQCANEVSVVLQNQDYKDFLNHMYGNFPHQWSESLKGYDRLRYILNALTRIRYCNTQGELDFSEKGDLLNGPEEYLPWFDVANRKNKDLKIIFGHWAALYNQWDDVIKKENIYPLDSGCVWGNQLTALCLEDNKRFMVACDVNT
ncbi:MAG: symmetrical bis(5'-nucleosyl)-tetraphosphatase [Gammaproteobacteria bacterium]